MTAVTNVNPGDRDPRNGRFGGSRKFFSRDRSDDLLQDRDDLADDLAQDHAPEHYETAGDGSFDEALEEFYDTHADHDYARTEPASRGKHHRVEEVIEPEEVEYADYDDYSDYDDTGHAAAAAGTAGAGYADSNYAEGVESEYVDAEVDADYERGYEPYYADEDDRTVSAGAPAAAAAPAAAGTAASTGGSSTAAAAGGVPKRGLAMILIAVALLLALWGVYAMTKGGSDDQAANDPANQSAQDPNNPNAQNQNAPNAQGQNGQNGQGQAQGQSPNDPNAAGQQGQNPNDPNVAGQQGEQRQQGQNSNDPNAQNQGNGAAPADANAPMTRENMTVNVYNNSAITGFADQVATQAKDKGMKVGEVGNIPGEVVTFEENTVLFDKNTPGAEDRARELADRVGGVAVPIDDRIPDEAKKPGSLTLVLAENREVTL